MQGILQGQSNCFNVATLPPQVTNLVLSQSPGTITGSFNGVDAAWPGLVTRYRIVYKAGGMPVDVYDGDAINVQPQGLPIYTFTISGLSNGVSYGVRVFVRGPEGFQTSEIAQGTITPVAGLQASSLPVGSKIKFAVGGVDYNWLIVNVGNPDAGMYDASCNGVWLLIENIYELRPWNSSILNDYENSEINAYLNGDFYNLIESGVQSQIVQAKIPYRAGNGNSNVVNTGTNGLTVKVFFLSGNEVGFTQQNVNIQLPNIGAKLEYFLEGNGDGTSDNIRISYFNGNANIWWTRTPYTSNSVKVWTIYTNGRSNAADSSYSYGNRPALILPLNFMRETTPNSDGSYSPI